jgi:hypothetical protein
VDVPVVEESAKGFWEATVEVGLDAMEEEGIGSKRV